MKVFFSGPGSAHGVRDDAAGDLARAAHVCDLGGGLDGAKLVDDGVERDPDGGEPGLVRVHEAGNQFAAAAVAGRVLLAARLRDVGVDSTGTLEDLGEAAVDTGNVVCLVGVEDVEGGLDAVAGAHPLLRDGLLWPGKEVELVVAVVLTRLADDGDRVALVPAGEVEEVGVLAVGEEDGAGAIFEVGGGEDGDGVVWEALGEAGAAIVIFLGCYAWCDWRVVLV